MSGKEQLKQYIKEHSFRENYENPFKLASGKESPFYFNLKLTLFNPEMLAIAIKEMVNLIVETRGRLPAAIGGLTMGADPLVYGISLFAHREAHKSVLPVVVRKKTKDHGSQQKVEGLLERLPKDESIVLLDDVITTGGSTLQAFNSLKDMGFGITDAFCLVDRQEGGKANMAHQGLTLHSLFTASDFRSRLD